jgi:hypothetical protein
MTYNRKLDFNRDDMNILARKFYCQNYSLYKDEIYKILMKRIVKRVILKRISKNISSKLQRFIRREKLNQIERNKNKS